MTKKDDNFHYIRIGMIIVLILMALYIGHRVGYIQGYEYVQEYKDDYIGKWCSCIDPPEKGLVRFPKIDINFTGYEIK